MRYTFLTFSFFLFLATPVIAKNNSSPLQNKIVSGFFAKRPHVPDSQVLQLLQVANKKTIQSEAARLTVWNIYKGKIDGLAGDLFNFVVSSDVVMIQEWIQTSNLVNLAKTFQNTNATMAAGFWNKDDFMTGVMTAAKSDPTYTEWIRSQYFEPLIKTPKMALLTEYYFEKLNKHILFINIHGLNRTSTKKFARQMEQIEERIKDYKNPIVFGGDFNTRNKSRTKYLKDWAARNNFKLIQFSNDPRKKILDYIMTRDLTVTSATLYPSIVTSDHTAMGIEFY